MLPYEQDINQDRISVPSGLGAAVIGRVAGDLGQFATPIGIIPLRFEKVEQSEAFKKGWIPDATYKKYLYGQQRASQTGFNLI
jgi:hypothetical protein